MNECPELSALESARVDDVVRSHLIDCNACRLAHELFLARDATAVRGACDEFEDLIAARATGQLALAAREALERHLETCVNCRVIANGAMTMSDIRAMRMTPTGADLRLLPEVDPDAYVLGNEVARGGMGRILEARDLRVGRHVAVKELLGASATHAARFEREARVTARLQHPGIVPIYEIGRWPDGTPFYSMRMVEGRTLRDSLKGASSSDQRLALLPSVIAAAEAVAYAHARSIVHRDLSPANIMIGDYGETVVIDWGLAKALDSDDDAAASAADPYRTEPASGQLTMAGSVVGTAAYMPPEQASGEVIDARADVYALGAILYHLLAGTAPYRGGSSLEVLEHVKTGPPMPLAVVAPRAPRDLVSIVEKAMHRDRAQRYTDARALAAELVSFRDGRIVEAHAYSRRELARRWVRRHRAVVLAASAAFVALLVTGGIALVGVLRERDRADAERAAALASRAEAQRVNTALLEEQGRQELLRGEPERALAYLDAAMQAGADSPVLRTLLGFALRPIEAREGTFKCDAGALRGFTSAPEGTEVALICEDIELWDLRTRRRRLTLPARDSLGVRYTADGTALLTAGKRIVRWNRATGEQLQETTLAGPDLRRMWFSADRQHVVAVDTAYMARAQDLESGTVKWEHTLTTAMRAPAEFGLWAAFGNLLVGVNADGTVETRSITDGARVGTFAHPGPAAGMTATRDGSTVVTCGADGRVRIWSAKGVLQGVIDAHTKFLAVCLLDQQDEHLLLGDFDGRFDLWDLRTRALVHRLDSGDPHGAQTGAFDPSGTLVGIQHSDGISVWDVSSGALLETLPVTGRWQSFTITPDARVVARTGGSVTTWRIVRPAISFVAPRGTQDEAVNLDGTRLAVRRTADDSLAIYDTQTGNPIIHASLVHAGIPTVSDDGRRLATSTPSGVVVIEFSTGLTLATLPAAAREVPLSLDAHGQRLLVGGADPVLYDVERGVSIASWNGKRDGIAVSSDGIWALVRHDETRFEVIDSRSGRVRASIVTTGGDAWSPGFSADGTRVVLVEQGGMYGNGRVGVWNTDTGALVLSTTGSSPTLDPERTMLSTMGRGRAELWRLADGQPISAAQVRGTESYGGYAPAPSTDGHLYILDDVAAAAAVIDPRTGRVIARLGRTQLTSEYNDNGLETLSIAPHWIPGTRTVVLPSRGISVWTLPYESRGAAEIHAIAGRAAWRVEGSGLVPVLGRVRGRVTRAGRPAPGATVVAVDRWFSAPYVATTDARGAFTLSDVPPSLYDVHAEIGDARSPEGGVDVRVGDPSEVSLIVP